MVSDNPTAAVAARSPAATAPPAGTVLPVDGSPTAIAVAGDRLAVAVGNTVLLYPLTEAGLGEPAVVPLSTQADALTVEGDTLLVSVGDGGELVRVALPAGSADAPVAVEGQPVSAAEFDGRTLVAVRDRKSVAVLDGDRVQRTISGGLLSADQVLSTGQHAVVLDRLRNAVFALDVSAGTVDEGLRAGQGSTNAVTDRFGRVLVADTRGDALLAFSVDPLLLRQNYPVPGAPYGLAYDRERDVLWVTLTETNEVVGYDVAGEEPRERHRFPTVEQPNTVTVDPKSGRVIVASATGKGIQVIAV